MARTVTLPLLRYLSGRATEASGPACWDSRACVQRAAERWVCTSQGNRPPPPFLERLPGHSVSQAGGRRGDPPDTDSGALSEASQDPEGWGQTTMI